MEQESSCMEYSRWNKKCFGLDFRANLQKYIYGKKSNGSFRAKFKKKIGLFETYEFSNSGRLETHNKQVERNWVYPVCGVLGAITLVAAGSAVIYKLMSN